MAGARRVPGQIRDTNRRTNRQTAWRGLGHLHNFPILRGEER